MNDFYFYFKLGATSLIVPRNMNKDEIYFIDNKLEYKRKIVEG